MNATHITAKQEYACNANNNNNIIYVFDVLFFCPAHPKFCTLRARHHNSKWVSSNLSHLWYCFGFCGSVFSSTVFNHSWPQPFGRNVTDALKQLPKNGIPRIGPLLLTCSHISSCIFSLWFECFFFNWFWYCVNICMMLCAMVGVYSCATSQ